MAKMKLPVLVMTTVVAIGKQRLFCIGDDQHNQPLNLIISISKDYEPLTDIPIAGGDQTTTNFPSLVVICW